MCGEVKAGPSFHATPGAHLVCAARVGGSLPFAPCGAWSRETDTGQAWDTGTGHGYGARDGGRREVKGWAGRVRHGPASCGMCPHHTCEAPGRGVRERGQARRRLKCNDRTCGGPGRGVRERGQASGSVVAAPVAAINARPSSADTKPSNVTTHGSRDRTMTWYLRGGVSERVSEGRGE